MPTYASPQHRVTLSTDPPPPYTPRQITRASTLPANTSNPRSRDRGSSGDRSHNHNFHLHLHLRRAPPLRKTPVPTLRNETTQAFRRGRGLLNNLLDRGHRLQHLSTADYARDLDNLYALAEELSEFKSRYQVTRESIEGTSMWWNCKEEMELVGKTLVVMQEIVTQYDRLLGMYRETGPEALLKMKMVPEMWDEDKKKYPKEW